MGRRFFMKLLTQSRDSANTTIPLIEDTIGRHFERMTSRFSEREAPCVCRRPFDSRCRLLLPQGKEAEVIAPSGCADDGVGQRKSAAWVNSASASTLLRKDWFLRGVSLARGRYSPLINRTNPKARAWHNQGTDRAQRLLGNSH